MEATVGTHWGYTGIMENKMETTIGTKSIGGMLVGYIDSK